MPPGDDAPRDHTLRSESGGESLQVPGLTSAFTCGFRPYAAHRLLLRPVAGWRKRRISGVHSKSPLEFLEPFHQHQKTSTCRRPTLVPRLLRNTVRFDQRSFAHTRRMSEFTNSEKINSVNGYCGTGGIWTAYRSRYCSSPIHPLFRRIRFGRRRGSQNAAGMNEQQNDEGTSHRGRLHCQCLSHFGDPRPCVPPGESQSR